VGVNVLIKPKKLQPGDRVTTVSPSWGGAGEPALRWRYEQGVKRLEEIFGLKVIPMPNSLKGGDYLYKNPQARAEDLMTAFKDESIKGIIANIGGEDSIRLLPYIDFDVIRENPKIKELQKKEKALAEATALLLLRKKAQAILGDDEEE
jgi:muramoyltetrapeptide carboxypeptidase LdcA involved in peptidoglycan recycling